MFIQNKIDHLNNHEDIIAAEIENADKMFFEYFEQEKCTIAKNVYGNYVKNIKHTISVIGWCNGFFVDDSFTLRLNSDN